MKYATFCQCEKKNVYIYVEEQQTVQDKLDGFWLSVNRKNEKCTLNEASQNASF